MLTANWQENFCDVMMITIENARQVALNSQLYRLTALDGKMGVYELIQQLGYVQIDTISVVERAHHHTIWSRINAYDKRWLDELLAEDRLIFEHWGHAASYLPMEDYRFSLPRMQRFPDTSSWEKQFFDTYKHLLQDVLARITAEGPLGAKDFKDSREIKTNYGWGSGKPEKTALELLMWSGELMVARRDKFQRIYDLRERVLPSWVDTTMPTTEELFRHYITKSLSAMGIGTEADIRAHYMQRKCTAFTDAFQSMLAEGELEQVKVSSLDDSYYVLSKHASCINSPAIHSDQAYLLSPFDNAVINRSRLKRMFGFDYTLECYVTPQKRIYGYWCLPVLYKGEFVARLDCKANRASHKMELISLHWEKGTKQTSTLLEAMQRALDNFARFCGCETTPIGR